MNRRLAEHQSRKGLSVVEQDAPDKAGNSASSRAAQAAARVAARFAHAPSYSEMQADEARAALRAAEVATRAALEAQAAAQVALDNLSDERERFDRDASHRDRRQDLDLREDRREDGRQAAQKPDARQAPVVSASSQPFYIRWEPDMPSLHAPAEAAPAWIATAGDEAPMETGAGFDLESADPSIQIVEPGEPINANLIQFPRELVATRRLRPRITGANPGAPEPQEQLSIFEVDPSTISTGATAPSTEVGSPDRATFGAEWSGIRLGAEAKSRAGLEPEPAAARPVLHLAPLGLRAMAVAVDAALIVALVCGMVALVTGELHHFPAVRTAEFGGVAAVVLIAIAYYLVFFLRIEGTPGMKYARIALCTFDDENPTRVQLRSRLVAMLLSVLPVGLGVAWAIFDEDHLSWHDRISGTYLRAY